MAVSQKIISGNSQPNGGRVIAGLNGARGLDSSSVLDVNHTQNSPLLASINIDQSITVINSVLNSRYDDTTYYE
jgi:hypothetical protein